MVKQVLQQEVMEILKFFQQLLQQQVVEAEALMGVVRVLVEVNQAVQVVVMDTIQLVDLLLQETHLQ